MLGWGSQLMCDSASLRAFRWQGTESFLTAWGIVHHAHPDLT